MGAPGVYIKAKSGAAQEVQIRTNRGALIGFAAKGPVNVAVFVDAWSRFVEIFSDERVGYLADSAKAWFDNGGKDLYVIRVLPSGAATSSVGLGDAADSDSFAFTCYAAAPADVGPGSEQQRRQHSKYDEADVAGDSQYYRLKSPGLWGDDLRINLTLNVSGSLDIYKWQKSARQLQLSGIADLAVGSLLQLSGLSNKKDDKGEYLKLRYRSGINKVIKGLAAVQLESDQEIDLDSVQNVEALALRLRVFYKHQLVEEIDNLAIGTKHQRYFVRHINKHSRYIAIDEHDRDKKDRSWLDHLSGDHPLDGGNLHLNDLEPDDFKKAIGALALEGDISLVAAPDIVYRRHLQEHQSPPLQQYDNCAVCTRVPMAPVSGVVVDKISGEAIEAVRVIAHPQTGETVAVETFTDGNGKFETSAVGFGHTRLTVEKDGYVLESFAIVHAQGAENIEPFRLSPIEMPRQFNDSEMADLQISLLEQADRLKRFFVILDIPFTANKLAQVRQWRYRFDSQWASFNYPWLNLNDEGQTLPLPPSALVMGALASQEENKGLMHATANLPMITDGTLRHQLTAAEHGQLNDSHINVLTLIPGQNIRLMGARTLSFERHWRYISSARLMLFLIRFIGQRMQWASFEKNDQLLGLAAIAKLNGLLGLLWRMGAIKGGKPAQAFEIVYDPQTQQKDGELVADIGIAIAEPGEFIWLTYHRRDDQHSLRIK